MKNEIKIGLTLMAAVLIIYLCFAWMKSIHIFDDGHKNYNITFDNVNGLLKGASVNIFGYTAGEVVDIQPTQENVIVKIRLSNKITLHTDATAEIQLKELMGGKQIEIRPGANGQIVAENGTIEGYISPDLTTAFSTFGEAMRAIDTTRIKSMLHNMEKITLTSAEFAEHFNVAMVNDMMGELKATSKELRQTASSVNQIADQVKDVNPKLMIEKSEKLLEDLAITLKNVETLVKNTDNMLKNSEVMMNNADKLTQKVENKMLPHTDSLMIQVLSMLNQTDKTLLEVQSIVSILNSNTGIAGKVLHDENFTKKIDSTLNSINETMDYVRQNRLKIGLKFK